MTRAQRLPRTLVASAAALSLLACGTEAPESTESLTGHAERVYGEYAEASQGRIEFHVQVLRSGALGELAGEPINGLVGVPAEWIDMEQRGTEVVALRREAGRPAGDEWAAPVSVREFDALGHPVAEGRYRLLEVGTELGGVATAHRALEVCWAAQGYCLVMDPVVEQLEGFVSTRRQLQAEGWKVQEQLEPGQLAQGLSSQAGTCSLNSNPGYTRRSLTWNGYRVDYKNLYGITVVSKTVGGQQAGVSCYVNGAGACVSSGFGYSYASSCWANVGFSCDCENTGNLVGVSSDGAATKSWSETRCAHQAILTANASFTVNGSGASFSVNWQTSGSVDSNGGQLYDSCSFR